jgi:hypothetical protein
MKTKIHLISKTENMEHTFLKEINLRGLVVRVPGYRLRCPGSIPNATRFSEK